MLAILFLGTIAVASATVVIQPCGFTIRQYDTPTGNFISHDGYLTKKYTNGTKTRTVITTPQGTMAEVSINTFDRSTFCLRAYDFAVIYDCTDSAKIKEPCVVSGYQALGTKESGVYTSITMANTGGIRTFRSRSNMACVDFCVDTYDSTISDPKACMLGFQAYWAAISSLTTTSPLKYTAAVSNPATTSNTAPVPTQPNTRVTAPSLASSTNPTSATTPTVAYTSLAPSTTSVTVPSAASLLSTASSSAAPNAFSTSVSSETSTPVTTTVSVAPDSSTTSTEPTGPSSSTTSTEPTAPSSSTTTSASNTP